MFFFNRNQALGLPKGSVRAILALLMVGALTIAFLAGAVQSDQFIPLAAVAVGFYFGARSDAKPEA